jgi:hypothetical protein
MKIGENAKVILVNRIENAFEITRNNVEKYKDILSKEDYEIFVKAFFSKKDNLDKVNCEFKNKKE